MDKNYRLIEAYNMHQKISGKINKKDKLKILAFLPSFSKEMATTVTWDCDKKLSLYIFDFFNLIIH